MSDEATQDCLKAAWEAYAAGLCIIPPAEDGTKRPLANATGRWEEYKTRGNTKDELRRWYPGRTGIGVVTGPVSGHVECWDFDDRPTYQDFLVRAEKCGLGEVVDRIEAGCCDNTPGDGVRWLVHYPPEVNREPSTIKLARRREQHDKGKIKTLIELPGYSIVAPTNGKVHPSGRPYVRRSGAFHAIAAYTCEEREAMFELARSFDAMSRKNAEPTSKGSAAGTRPGDDYASKTTWSEVLEPEGWKSVFSRDGVTYWRRPGKDIGISATTNYGGADLLYVFSTSTLFDAETSYTRFGAYTMLKHGGDFSAAAKSLAKEGYGTRQHNGRSERSASEVLHQVDDYRETADGVEWCKSTRDGQTWVRLTNFRALIISDITQDDGVEPTHAFEIETHLNGRSHTFSLPTAKFSQMGWPLEHLGAEAAVQPGLATKDRTRYAIQVLSQKIQQRRVYTHTGWTKVDGHWVYLHGRGAVGEKGPIEGLEVQLRDQLERYEFPDACPDSLRQDIDASLGMLKVAPLRITMPILGATYRAAIGGADFSLHVSGPTGAQKTELAALAQQHFGSEMNARALPGSWSSTANSLEVMAFAAKDAVLVIDDYVPQGTTADRARLNALADRVLRAQGNRSGRARLRPDASLRRARPPRGLVISTGEEVPSGSSLRARLAIVDVQRGDVIIEQLTMAQQDAAQGAYARAMAAFIKWLAPRLDQVRKDFTTLTHERRNKLSNSHARTADAIAQLGVAWSIWLRFVVDVGAARPQEVVALEESVWQTLVALAVEQADLQRANDPVDRFRELLMAALASGRAHVASATLSGGRRPDKPEAWGWRRGNDDAWYPRGDCVGWCDEHGLYLEPEASYAAALKMGEGVSIAVETLHRRMFERGILLSHETRGGSRRLKVRKTIDGKRREVLHVAHDLRPPVRGSGPCGPTDPSCKMSEESEDFE